MGEPAMSRKIEKIESGSVTTPKGFKAAGIASGIKKSGKLDLGLLFSQVRCAAAGVFTTNVLKGASLLVSREHLTDGHAQAVIVNSGNANASTGERGMLDAREMCCCTARYLDIPAHDVLPSSTGVIGEYLPLPAIRTGIESLVPRLHENGGEEMARAIMTTDTVPKLTARRVTVEGHSFSIGGIAKGAGMIHPNMATMLVFLTTDARVNSSALHMFLMEAVDKSFNRLTIDGDTSCDDTVLLLANGLASGVEIVPDGDAIADAFREALQDLCLDLTLQLARDGEGVTKVVTIRVKGARTGDDAVRIARSMATSSLVKTAFHGQDPNWGRLITAAGYAGVSFDPNQTDMWIGNVNVMKNGERAMYEEIDAAAIMQQADYEVLIDLKQGDAKDFYITTDLSNAYIDINADYRHRT
jgi:glutamate N-acetyltransferase/amino-acid N-acetyltransferase